MSYAKRITLLLVMLLLAGNIQADNIGKRYHIKSGIIKYELSGQKQGTEELYWDDYGRRETRISNASMTVFGMTHNADTISILDGDWFYNIDPNKNTATKINHKELMQKLAGNENSKQPVVFGEKMIKAFGGEKTGTEKVLGRKCDIYELKNLGGYRIWVWKGIALKAEMNMMNMSFRMEAVNIKENARIDQAKLALPAGVRVTEEQDVAQMPDQAEMKQAMEQMQMMQNSEEFQEAMRMMKQMQDDPQMHKAMKQMQEYQKQMGGQFQQAQTQAQSGKKSFPEKAGEIVAQETSHAVEETIRDATRQSIKKGLGGLLKSVF